MNLFQAYLEVSIVSVMLVAFGFALFALFSGRIPARYRKRIWLLLALQLIIPIRFALPDAPVSLPAPNLAEHITLLGVVESQPLARMPSNLIAAPTSQGMTLMQIGYIAWLLGTVGYAVFQLVGYCFMRRKMMRWSTPVAQAGTLQLMTALCKELNIHQSIQLRESKEIHSPLMMGLFRPVIMLPGCCVPSVELDLALRHELCHFKSGDIPYKLAMLLAQSLHWFNPVVHIMTRQAEVDLEYACDDAVIRSVGPEHRMAYGETILSVAHGELRFTSALTTHFYSGKKSLIERMKNLMNTDKRGKGILIASLFLVLFIASSMLVGFAGATEQTAQISDSAHVRENFGLLLGLRFPGYLDMSVSAYRDLALNALDQPRTHAEYARQLDRYDPYVWDNRYIDQDASFILNTLTPMIAENWTLWRYPNWVQNPTTQGPIIEYQLSRELLTPSQLTVAAYEQAVFGIMNDINTLALNHCQGDRVDESAILEGIERLEAKYSNQAIRFTVDAFLYPESDSSDPDNASLRGLNEEQWTTAAKADYDLVLALCYDGYQNDSVTAFTTYIQDAFTRDEATPMNAAYERVYTDVNFGRPASYVTEADLQFIHSMEATIREYAAQHQSQFAGERLYPIFRGNFFGSNTLPYSCVIEYDFRVEMLEGDFITVGERDQRISAILNGVDTYLHARNADAWKDGEQSLIEQFNVLCAQNSDAKMKCSPVKMYYDVTPYGTEKANERGF